AALSAVGHGAARLVRDVAAGRVGVSGDGLAAQAARGLLGPPVRGRRKPRLQAWIDFTADAEELTAATAAVEDLGVVVVAGEPGVRRVPINLYRDVHARGLRVVGVAPPLAEPSGSRRPPASAPPREAALGTPVARAPWYRISSDLASH
ncbi:MAG: hypothetical protein M3155_09150, partial [Actinomycetota bacterium]|nr:hypothetical protein [Actinomycetota bacterium]